MLSFAAMRAWRLPRVTMFFQYLYRDEPELGRFQTGLVFAGDRWKPSLQAFKLPFAQMGRRGNRATVWGQVRGGPPGRKPYRLEVLQKNVWKQIGPERLTNEDGVFIRTIRLKRGALLRVSSPGQRRRSLQLRIRYPRNAPSRSAVELLRAVASRCVTNPRSVRRPRPCSGWCSREGWSA